MARRPETGTTPLTERSSRVVFARKLLRRAGRDRSGAFLVEGAQAVGEALAAHAAGAFRIRDLFVTADQRDWGERARAAGIHVHLVTEKAAASLSETRTPQGVVAVCDRPQVEVADALARKPDLVAVLLGVSDPGNAGTVVRVADAAGAGAVLFAGDTVDPFNGKAVRASTGSLFHLPLARDRDAGAVLGECRRAGLRLVGADGRADEDLDSCGEATLATPTAWVFGSEAHGLDQGDDLRRELDATLRVPLYGKAESLNLATAAAVCLYASARAQHRS